MKKAIILSIALVMVLTGCSLKGGKIKTITAEEAKAKAETFINDELIAGGAEEAEASITAVVEENGLYKLSVVISSGGREQEIESYVSRDGKKFFTQAIDMTRTAPEAGNTETDTKAKAPVSEVSNKQAKPKVELFVMSHCPYGTQIEKGMLPVVEALGDKIDFELKFCDYAMHGEIEVKEQMGQYCIQKEQPEKFIEYLTCFLDEGKTTGCLAKTKINQSKMNSCVDSVDKEYKVIENLNDKTSWYNGKFPMFNINKDDTDKYGIKGSPALVINGETIASARDSATLFETICSSFTSVPEECAQTLLSTAPTPGFGYNTNNSNPSNSDATCN